MGFPTIYPTGVTIYNKEKASNGYTVFPTAKGVVLVDMNGREVHQWNGLIGNPAKILPGGYVMGSTGRRDRVKHPFDNLDLVQVDWDGNVVWKYDHTDYVEEPGETPGWTARQNHDYQRQGSSVGYYYPEGEIKTDHGNTMILSVKNVVNPQISSKTLLDSVIIEVDWEGNIVWQWWANEHFDEFGFTEEAKNAIYRLPSEDVSHGGQGYWLAINNFNTLGPNKWFDAGDERFHPDNIIFDARNANVMGIISKKTGKLVWRLGPNFKHPKEPDDLGHIIGQHHLHMIPKGLPGEGNLLVFDNGGWAGYGQAYGVSKYGTGVLRRDYSRVLEFDPVTLKIVWQYTPIEAGHVMPLDSYKFFSSFISSAQRLENGNTLITEGRSGRLIEVTPEHETVWEYVNPYYEKDGNGLVNNWIYRSYRVPYEWIPQLTKPREISVEAPNITTFRVPGAPAGPGGKVTEIKGVTLDEKKLVENPFLYREGR